MGAAGWLTRALLDRIDWALLVMAASSAHALGRLAQRHDGAAPDCSRMLGRALGRTDGLLRLRPQAASRMAGGACRIDEVTRDCFLSRR